MSPTRWVLVLFVLVLLPLVWRALHLAAIPPFTPGLPEGTPMRLDAERLVLMLPCGSGTLEVRAERASSGHEDALTFRLGPSTFVELGGVEVVYREGDGVRWRARGPRARLDPDALAFTQPAVHFAPEDAPRPVRRLRIDLASGRLSFD